VLSFLLLLGCRHEYVDREIVVGGPVQNLLMLSIDTLRRDGLTRFGGSGDMPFLDDWFDRAVSLDDHLSCSNWTYSSMICALTGRTPLNIGFLPLNGQGPQFWPQPVPMLSERLQKAGFTTGLFSASQMLSDELGTDVGYASLDYQDGASAGELLPATLPWLTQAMAEKERWFLHVHVIDPHGPYDPPDEVIPEFDGPGNLEWDLRFPRDFSAMREVWTGLDEATQAEVLRQVRILYAGELRQLDGELAQWMSQIQELGALDNTLVVIYSDHGEQFAEHGRWFHGNTLHAEEVNAIAGLRAPGLSSQAITDPTWHIDLPPTILVALDLPQPDRVQGVPVGLAASDRVRSVLRFDRTVSPRQLLVQDGMRLHYRWSGGEELFDTTEDPNELRDISVNAYRDAARLWRYLDPEVTALHQLQDVYEPNPTW
jgi:arylsulfatase A-like enzyme